MLKARAQTIASVVRVLPGGWSKAGIRKPDRKELAVTRGSPQAYYTPAKSDQLGEVRQAAPTRSGMVRPQESSEVPTHGLLLIRKVHIESRKASSRGRRLEGEERKERKGGEEKTARDFTAPGPPVSSLGVRKISAVRCRQHQAQRCLIGKSRDVGRIPRRSRRSGKVAKASKSISTCRGAIRWFDSCGKRRGSIVRNDAEPILLTRSAGRGARAG